MGWESAWRDRYDTDPGEEPTTPSPQAYFKAGYSAAAAEHRAAIRELLAALKTTTFDIPRDWTFAQQVPLWRRALIEETGDDYMAELHRALVKAETLAGEEAS
jgi:hypothetical protein